MYTLYGTVALVKAYLARTRAIRRDNSDNPGSRISVSSGKRLFVTGAGSAATK